MKNDSTISVREIEFRHAINETHDCDTKAIEGIVQIKIPQRNSAPWEGEVHVFEVSGHRSATRCYAWAESLGKTAIVIHTVLHSDRISSSEKAVKSVLRRRGHRRSSL